MMYDEFVKALREAENCTKETLVNPYRFVPYYGKAADIIEARDKAAEEWEMLAESWQKACKVLESRIPRWIPVTEGLPKTRESILGKKSNKVIVAFHFSDGTQGTDTAHTLNGEWVFEDHITAMERTITHWQPLPELPKRET